MSETNPAPETAHGTLRGEIAERLATASKDIREIVIKDMTNTEIARRAEAVKAVVLKLDEKTKELKKAENKGTYDYNAKGDKIGEPVFTKEEAEALKKQREEIGKLESALQKAFTDNDFSKVMELGGK